MTGPFKKTTPEYRNIRFSDITMKYHMPLAAYVSILHRISGVLLFLLLPFLLFIFDQSLTSEVRFKFFISILSSIAVKLVILMVLFGFVFHFFSGIRHLSMDLNHNLSTKESGKVTAIAVLCISLLLTFFFALKLFKEF